MVLIMYEQLAKCDDCNTDLGLWIFDGDVPTDEEIDDGITCNVYCTDCYFERRRDGI